MKGVVPMQNRSYKFFQLLPLLMAISVSASCSKPQNRSKNRPSKSETSSDAKGSESKGLSELGSAFGIEEALEGDFEDLTYEEARRLLDVGLSLSNEKPLSSNDASEDESEDDSEDKGSCSSSPSESGEFEYKDGSLRVEIKDFDMSSCDEDKDVSNLLSMALSFSCQRGESLEPYDGKSIDSLKKFECLDGGVFKETFTEYKDDELEFTAHTYAGNDSLNGEYREVHSDDDETVAVKDKRIILVYNYIGEGKNQYIDLRPDEDIVYDKDKKIYLEGAWKVRLNNWEGKVSFNEDGNLDYEISDGESTKNGSIEVE